MNQHQAVLSQANPAVPYANGRPSHNIPYTPHPYPQQPQQYPNYPYQYHYPYARPPPQWSPYPIPMPMGRGYHMPPVNPYPTHQHFHPGRPQPHQHPSNSSLHSPQTISTPSPSNMLPHAPPPATPAHSLPPRPPPPQSPPISPATAPKTRSPPPAKAPFQPPLPWQSFDGDFPARKTRRRRKQRDIGCAVELPSPPNALEQSKGTSNESELEVANEFPQPGLIASERSSLETPPTSHPPSEIMSTQPTTPSSTTAPQLATPKASAAARTVVPSGAIVPIIPNIPLPSRTTKKDAVASNETAMDASVSDLGTDEPHGHDQTLNGQTSEDGSTAAPKPVKVAPKSWADLVRIQASSIAKRPETASQSQQSSSRDVIATKAKLLADIINNYDYKTRNGAKIAFLEPRGLINTGNMCYMNSVLQVLLFCVPFYSFLEIVGKQATHSFKSETPVLDALIMFIREFAVIDAAASVDQLRMRLKDHEFEIYGAPFTPEFVYEVTRQLPRFSSMRRGHQQDAEEFLGFLLEELHDECSRATNRSHSMEESSESLEKDRTEQASPGNVSAATDEDGWLEVGPKQKPAVTRTSGHIATESPITKVFGGKLRSELRIPGKKNSVTLEPYQPLQLDIGAPHVHNILDALKGLTRSETLHGEFSSPRGTGSTATKQVTVETLPQVLILHLKRFQYDNTGGTQKIWKKIGYPLNLEIPKEVFPQHRRGAILAHGGLPKYRLTAVVYHHGKNAGGGHYTVDVQRQDNREWLRFDDTHIQRIRSEDVAAQGSEEDPKLLAAALEKTKNEIVGADGKRDNPYSQIPEADDVEEDEGKKPNGWNQVDSNSGASHSGHKRWSSVANGIKTPKATDSGRITPAGKSQSVKDNKVAYILFYQREGA